MIGYWDRYMPDVRERDNPLVSIARADHVGLPPTLVVTASHDPLRVEGELYAGRLAAAGVPTRCVRYEGTVQGFVVRFPVLCAGRSALSLICQTVRDLVERPDPIRSWLTEPVLRTVGPVGQ